MRLVRSVCVMAIVAATALPACAGKLSSKPGEFEVREDTLIRGDRKLPVTFVKPAKPRDPAYLVLFASGDAGYMAVCGDALEHIADRGHYVVSVDSRDVVKNVKKSGALADIRHAADRVNWVIAQSKQKLGLPESTRVIVTGYSRGANFVVFAAGVKSVQQQIVGGVAMALTRETDFLQAPPAAERPPELQVDEKGRIQTYPALALAGPIPFAVIQAKGDKYVRAEEARQLFGANTPTRRLYEVDASNHGFSGGKDELMRDLDDALSWIEESAKSRSSKDGTKTRE